MINNVYSQEGLPLLSKYVISYFKTITKPQFYPALTSSE